MTLPACDRDAMESGATLLLLRAVGWGVRGEARLFDAACLRQGRYRERGDAALPRWGKERCGEARPDFWAARR